MYDKYYVPYTKKRSPEIPAVEVTGHSESTPEEKAAAHEELMRLIARSKEIRAKKKAGIPVDDSL